MCVFVCFGLTADAAIYHPADHTQQKEKVAHEVAVISTSCMMENNHKLKVTGQSFSSYEVYPIKAKVKVEGLNVKG